jgi:O-6-methylguanine DNA methyltransferase
VKTPLIQLPVETSDGVFLAKYSENGLTKLDFPKAGGDGSAERQSIFIPATVRGWHRLTTKALKNALKGRPTGPLPPLDWTGRTEFQKSVWRALLKIAPGQSRSYGELARSIGRPKAVRAVGGACGANPVPVLVPCHRVLAANHRLGGFSGGLNLKRALLDREGVRVQAFHCRIPATKNPPLKRRV